MEHNLKINVSKNPTPDSIVYCKNVKIRERLLRLLLGDCRKVTILVPGDSVSKLSIIEEGGVHSG